MARRRRTSRGTGLPVDVYTLRRKFGPGGAILIVLLLILLVLAERSGHLTRSGDWQVYHEKSFVVSRVIDGDTIRVNQPDGDSPTTPVRFWGIDTPELRHRPEDPPDQPGAQEARQRVEELVLDQPVTLMLQAHDLRDKYQRLLAYIILPDGRNLNLLLVEEGLAKADQRFSHDLFNQFLDAEKAARKKKLGLWARKLPVRTKESAEPALSR